METLVFLLTTTFYPPYHVGGDAVSVRLQAELLASVGHEVHVVFSPAAFRMKGGRLKELAEEEHGVHLHPVWKKTLDPLWAYLTGRTPNASSLEQLARELSPDVVHHHNISLLGLDVLRLRAERTLYTAHDPWLLCPKSDLLRGGGVCTMPRRCWACTLAHARPPQLWRSTSALERALQHIHCVVAPSRFYAELLGHLSVPVVHIPNFSPKLAYHPSPSPYILYSGVLEPHKGILQLAEQMCSTSTPYTLVVVGRGSLSRRLSHLANRHEQIEYLGWVDSSTLEQLRARASFVVLPSRWYENCPMAVIEAYASGVPVLVSRMGGLPEMVAHGKSGFVMGERLGEVFDAVECSDISQLKRGALEMHEERYSPQAFLRQYMQVLM